MKGTFLKALIPDDCDVTFTVDEEKVNEIIMTLSNEDGEVDVMLSTDSGSMGIAVQKKPSMDTYGQTLKSTNK